MAEHSMKRMKKRMSQVWAEATDICEVCRYMMPAYRAATEGSEAPLENCPDSSNQFLPV